MNKLPGSDGALNPDWLIGRKKFIRKYREQNGLCALCALPFAPEAMTRDHIVPRSKGGGAQWDNIQLACEPCNAAKADQTLEELHAKARSGGLTMAERLERQGLIFNHDGNISAFHLQL